VTASGRIHRAKHALISAIFLMAAAIPVAGACGRESDCVVGDRSYRIVLPPGHDGATPIAAIVFVHGYRGTADGVMRNDSLTALANDLSVAFVAPQAAGPEWNLPGVPSVDAQDGVEELAYFDALAADLEARFGVERSRTLVAGFSSGAMMVWHLACYRGNSYAGFVPMSGTFWEPLPQSCPAAPVDLIHYHGTGDPVVPLAGRQIKDGHQGNVHDAIDLMARAGGYRAVEAAPEAGLDCRRQESGGGQRLELCVFPGKHEMKAGHIVRAWRIFGGGP
jgi:polyhydroxybutyrate depolymerase